MQKSGFSGTMTQHCPIKPLAGDSIGRREQTYYSGGTAKLMGESVASFCGTPPWVEYPEDQSDPEELVTSKNGLLGTTIAYSALSDLLHAFRWIICITYPWAWCRSRFVSLKEDCQTHRISLPLESHRRSLGTVQIPDSIKCSSFGSLQISTSWHSVLALLLPLFLIWV